MIQRGFKHKDKSLNLFLSRWYIYIYIKKKTYRGPLSDVICVGIISSGLGGTALPTLDRDR
jgi:hypothetical protein